MQAKWNADITYQPAWLSLSRTSGTINAGSSQSVTLTVDRKKVTEDDTFYLDIEGNFLPEIIKISVSKSSGGGDDPGKPEDYSGATIISCDSRVTAQIVSCRRSGSSVEFKYVLTNNGMGSVNDWRIYPPKSMSLIQGGTRSVVWTNDGEEYLYPYMTFRDKYTSGSNVITATFPEGVPCSGSVTISDVSSSATKFNLTLGVYAYPNSTYHMSSSAIKFTNVPIY